MVSLHHMIDITINNILINIKRILKKNGLIIIKEHNCCNNEDKLIIDWEHHLYHLLLSNDVDEINTKKYLNKFINNYKSMKDFNSLFSNYGFTNINNLDRKFNKYTINDTFNPTNLYWALYKN